MALVDSELFFSLEYDCARDNYRRGDSIVQGWETLLSKQENVHRVVDDLNSVAYLCRVEGKRNGELCWSFDFTGHHIKNIKFRLDGLRKENDVSHFCVETKLILHPVSA